MKLLIFLPIVINALRITEKTPICRDCKYYIMNNKKCGKNAETDIITGDKTYELAEDMRTNEKSCGIDGNFFETNYFKVITVPYFFIKSNDLDFLPLIILSPIFLQIALIFYLLLTPR